MKKPAICIFLLFLVFTLAACAEDTLDVPGVLQKTVGTVENTYTTTDIADGEGYQSMLTKTFTGTTESDYTGLMEHYQSASTGTDEDGSLLYDWGWLDVTADSDYSTITINAYFK